MSIEDKIAKLPIELQGPARKYLALIVDTTTTELERWVDDVIDGKPEAYEFVVSHMSTTDLIAEQKSINEALIVLNNQNADFMTIQREIIKSSILFLISLAVKNLE